MISVEDLADAASKGKLVSIIFDRYFTGTELAEAASILALAHNSGRVDVLGMVDTPDFAQLAPFEFFTGQHWLTAAIPKVEATPQAMMRFVKALVDKGGNDGAANQPNRAIREWFKIDTGRAKEVIRAAEGGDELAIDHLTFALQAGGQVQEAIAFASGYSDRRRLCGVSALGSIRDQSQASTVIDTLAGVMLVDQSDVTKTNVLAAVLSVAETAGLQREQWIAVLRTAAEDAGPNVQFQCAQSLWAHIAVLDEISIRVLLGPLMETDPSHERTINELDLGLWKVMETPHAEIAIQFVTTFLPKKKGLVTLGQLDSFTRGLLAGDPARLHAVLISWLLSGEPQLCSGMSKALRDVDGPTRPLNIDFSKFDLSEEQRYFLSRKAIGYFFFDAVTAASILVSILRSASTKLSEAVGALLFDPLLINYGGEVREYLVALPYDDLSAPQVSAALALADRYLEDLRSAGEILELQPSEHHRQIENRRWHDEMRASFREAEKKSIFRDLVSRSTILFGRRSVTHVEDASGEMRRVEIALQEHSASVELPRMQIVDPHGFDFMLRVFRAERLKS